jgi:hypothetical protein
LIEVRVEDMLGSPGHPLSHDQHMEKARRCLAHAGFEFAHDRFAAGIATLDQADDVSIRLRI